MATSVVSFQARRVARLSRPAEAYDRRLRRRVYLAWGLVFLNVIPFYKGTWNMLPLIVPIPSAVGKMLTQGSLPAAVLVAWSTNRRMLIRPNVFLGLLTLLVVDAIIPGIFPVGHVVGTLYRTFRLGEFVAVLWLLSPLFDRRDLLLVKAQLTSLAVVIGSVLLGLLVSPHRALARAGSPVSSGRSPRCRSRTTRPSRSGWSLCSGSAVRYPGAALWSPWPRPGPRCC